MKSATRSTMNVAWISIKIVRYGIVGFNVPPNVVILGTILRVRWPNQQHYSTEGKQLLVSQLCQGPIQPGLADYKEK